MGLLTHRVDGEGPPLLLLNGIAMSMGAWGRIAETLAERFQVIRCDFRGQLLSPGPGPRDPSHNVGDLVALLDALNVDSVHLVGTSYGAAVAAIFAAEQPARAQSLVSIASADGFDEEMAEEIGRWRRACRDVLEGAPGRRVAEVLEPVAYSKAYLQAHEQERAIARDAMDDIPRRWFEDLLSLLEAADNFDLSPWLGRIRCPTLIVAAGADQFIPPARCRALSEAIPGARFDTIFGAGHAVVIEKPQVVTELVERFINP